MAAKLGFSRQHYARIENGTQEVSIRFLVKLGEVFGIDLDKARELTKIESI
jgi:transcriptional regulator with XRE-family HTH domain